jgi:nitric oxide reductase NorD protein
MNNLPLTAAEIETRLADSLDAALPPLAEGLAALTRAQQNFALRWVDVLAKTNAEMGRRFAAQAPDAFRLMEPAHIEAWLIRAMDTYDNIGLYPACTVLEGLAEFAAEAQTSAHAVDFADIEGVLALFVQGLSGRALKLAVAEECYTDTETLFLPARLALFAERDDNFRLYKITAAHLWAQTRFGTFRADGGLERLIGALAAYPDPARAATVFHALETLRLEACLARELPGLYRDLLALRAAAAEPALTHDWQSWSVRLAAVTATVDDTLAALSALYAADVPAERCYQGGFFPDRIAPVLARRLEREKQLFRQALGKLTDENRAAQAPAEVEKTAGDRLEARRAADTEHPDGHTFELYLDGQPLKIDMELRGLMGSIVQDLGQIPDDYLVPAGDGGYARGSSEEKPADGPRRGFYAEAGTFVYNEWDYRRRHYRKDWCVLRETVVHPSEEPFAAHTRRKYAAVLAGLRKTFEALRGEDRILKRQPSGDGIDFDALVEAHADMKRGQEMDERLFTRLNRVERNIAVMFMVDMSGSTKGWINDAERESLVLLCEALEILGDRYAIYGFSGMTRNRCELYRVKSFDEAYDERVQYRIAGITPKDYTRMGVTIRHLTKLLTDIEAKTKLLVTLSDGKPDDWDGYRGDYGIEDTRQALVEAKRAGIHPFCITIDTEARDYLPHMYGAVNWALVDDVKKLPLKVSDIYKRLTH